MDTEHGGCVAHQRCEQILAIIEDVVQPPVCDNWAQGDIGSYDSSLTLCVVGIHSYIDFKQQVGIGRRVG